MPSFLAAVAGVDVFGGGDEGLVVLSGVGDVGDNELVEV